MASTPVWRSLLYVPANNQRFIDKAHQRGADGIILDLEDSVPVAELDVARAELPQSVSQCVASGADVLVRVNATWEVWREDIEAAVIAGVRALVLPKVESSEEIAERVELIQQLELDRGLAAGSVGLFVLIESPAALFRVEEIARGNDRILALALGGEDFARSTGMAPTGETLAVPQQMTLFAARAAGVMPLGLLGSIADYADSARLSQIAAKSVRFGFEGATCIHPVVVPILNDAFTPSQIEVAEARRIVDAYDEATDRGVGAISLDGRMIDVPVAERSRRLLDRYHAISQKTGE